MPLGRTKPSHKLRENVYPYHLVNCDFQLLRRFGFESKVWKTHRDTREPGRLECRWQKVIWRAGLSENCHTPRDFQETKPFRGHGFDAPIFALRRENRKPQCRDFYSIVYICN